jgi:hypothetical protein
MSKIFVRLIFEVLSSGMEWRSGTIELFTVPRFQSRVTTNVDFKRFSSGRAGEQAFLSAQSYLSKVPVV